MNDRSYRKRALLGLQALDPVPAVLRRAMLRACGMAIDPRAFLESGVSFVAGRLTLGADAYVNRECLLDCRGGIRIGARTLLAPRVSVLTATHPVQPGYPRAGPATYAGVTIEDDCWIGAGAIILPGVTIGRGAVVAAGAVVRSSLPGDAVYGGVPARAIRALDTPAA